MLREHSAGAKLDIRQEIVLKLAISFATPPHTATAHKRVAAIGANLAASATPRNTAKALRRK
jgi:hypothetical protein